MRVSQQRQGQPALEEWLPVKCTWDSNCRALRGDKVLRRAISSKATYEWKKLAYCLGQVLSSSSREARSSVKSRQERFSPWGELSKSRQHLASCTSENCLLTVRWSVASWPSHYHCPVNISKGTYNEAVDCNLQDRKGPLHPEETDENQEGKYLPLTPDIAELIIPLTCAS